MQFLMLSPAGFIRGLFDQIYHLDEGDTLEVVATLPDGCFPLILSLPIFALLPWQLFSDPFLTFGIDNMQLLTTV